MENLSFEKAHEELEKLLAAMNSGKISLEESIALFEKGEQLMRYCEKQLMGAEQKIEKILKDRAGNAQVHPDESPKTAPFCSEEVPF